MKLKKIKKPNNKLLQLQIFKLYTKKIFFSSNTNFENKLINLRKIANIIYKYHNANKKILFIGFSNSFKQILKNTKHIFLPESFWFNGMLSNRRSTINSFEKKISKIILQLKKKLDLIVISSLNKNVTLIKEGKLQKIAIIDFRKNNGLINNKLPNNNFFFSFTKMMLSKSKKFRTYRNLSQLQKLYKKMFGKNNTVKSKFTEKRRINIIKTNSNKK